MYSGFLLKKGSPMDHGVAGLFLVSFSVVLDSQLKYEYEVSASFL